MKTIGGEKDKQHNIVMMGLTYKPNNFIFHIFTIINFINST